MKIKSDLIDLKDHGEKDGDIFMIILFDFILVKNGHFIALTTNRERQREKLLESRRERKTKIKRRIQNLFPQTFKNH